MLWENSEYRRVGLLALWDPVFERFCAAGSGDPNALDVLKKTTAPKTQIARRIVSFNLRSLIRLICYD